MRVKALEALEGDFKALKSSFFKRLSAFSVLSKKAEVEGERSLPRGEGWKELYEIRGGDAALPARREVGDSESP